jgi:tetratricopeptide (TPR) repeat protein
MTAPDKRRDDEKRDDETRDPVDLLAEQFLQRVRSGEALTPEAFASEHAPHATALRELLPTLLVLEQAKRERESSSTGARRASVPQLTRLGEFAIVRELGRGGMGVVFEAVQESLGRRVALKVLPQASLLSGNQLERFRREAQVAANLHHTHIVPVFGCGEADGYHYYAMQYIDGRGLDAVVRALAAGEPTPLPAALPARAPAVARLGEAVARALHSSHAAGTLHRDVKPANLLLEQNGHVWVADFGLAKALQHDGLTHSGDVVGTLQYLAPEQLEGRYDVRSEVYALGLVLYELLALRPAFAAATRPELLDRIRHGRSEPLRRACPALPADLATVIERAIAHEPARRYASAQALADDLRAFVEDRPIAARRTSQLEHAWRWCRRNRALAAACLVALLTTVGGAVVGWSMYLLADQRRGEAEQSANEASLAKGRAEGNVTLAMAAFEDVFDSLVGPDPLHAIVDDGEDADAGSTVALRAPVDQKDAALLQRMVTFYDRFAAQNAASKGLRDQTARAYRRLGGIQARLGDYDAAVAALDKALQLYRDVHERNVTRDLAATQQELGQVQLRRGRPSEASSCFRQSLQLLEGDPADNGHAARLLAARAHFLLATSLDLRPLAGPLRPGPLGRRGMPPNGPPNEQPNGDPPPRDPPPRDPPQGRDGSGGRRGPGMRPDAREVRTHLRDARELLAALMKEAPDDAEVQFLQARVLLFISRPGVGDRPSQQREEALGILHKLVERHPENDDFCFELVNALLQQPVQEMDVETLRAAVEQARRLWKQQPLHPEYQSLLGRSLSMLGARLMRGDRKTAEHDLREALDIETALVAATPQARFFEQLMMTRWTLARLLLAEDKADEARALLGQVADDFPKVADGGFLRQRFLFEEERQRGFLEVFERAGLGARAQAIREALAKQRR